MTSNTPEHFEQPPAEGFAGWLLLVLGIGGLVAAVAMHRSSVVLPFGPGMALGLGVAAGGAWLAPQTAALSIVVRFIYHLHYILIAGLVSVALAMPMTGLLDDYIMRQICVAGFTMSAPWTIAHLMANASGRRRVSVAYAAMATVVCLCAMQPSAWIWPLLIGAAVALVRIVPTKVEGEAPTTTGGLFNGTAFMLFNGIVLMGLGPIFGLFVMWIYGSTEDDARWTPMTDALTDTTHGTAPWIFAALRWAGFAAGFIVPVVLSLAWPRLTAIGSRPRACAGAILCLCAAGLVGGQSTLPTAIAALVIATVLVGAAAAAILPFAETFGGRVALALLGGSIGGTIVMQCANVHLSEPVWGLALWVVEAFLLAVAWVVAYTTGLAWLRNREA